MTSKIIKILYICIIIIFVASELRAGGENISDKISNLKQKIFQLGVINENPLEQIKALHIHTNAHLAAPLLVNELKVIKPYNMRAKELLDLDKEAMHIIWCVRALQSITGEKFIAYTKKTDKFPIQEYLKQKNPLPFFTEWMSREKIFVAPEDVQEEIIKKWRIYINKNPKFKIKEFSFWNDDSWYF